MGDFSAMQHTFTALPGAALKAFRRHRAWTLAVVSEKTGLPVSTLSRIENDQISPTYEQLGKLSRGLGIDLAELLSATPRPAQSARRSVNRGAEGSVLDTPMQRLLYLSADLTNKRFAPILADVKARTLAEFGELHQHEGEEFIFVLEGALELHTDNYAPLRLAAGESVYFDSGMGHAYLAVGELPCRILSICTSPRDPLGAR
jgi:transcriptional regulator with XRE-family HTH domain